MGIRDLDSPVAGTDKCAMVSVQSFFAVSSFSRLLRHTRGRGGSILTRILTGLHQLSNYIKLFTSIVTRVRSLFLLIQIDQKYKFSKPECAMQLF